MNKFRNVQEVEKAIYDYRQLLKTLRTEWAKKTVVKRIKDLQELVKEWSK